MIVCIVMYIYTCIHINFWENAHPKNPGCFFHEPIPMGYSQKAWGFTMSLRIFQPRYDDFLRRTCYFPKKKSENKRPNYDG